MSYTQLSNHFIDTEMRHLSASAVCVYLCICRHTTGWHKESDAISLSQFQTMTGMSKPTIIKAIKELSGRGIISVSSGRTLSVASTLTLIASASCCDSSTSQLSLLPTAQTSKESLLPASKKSLPKVVKKIDTQKKEKKTTKKKESALRDERLSQWQFTVYRELTHLHVPYAYRDEVAQLTDESIWRAVILKWIGRGYRPTGIAGMIEWYRKEVSHHGRNTRQSMGGSGNHTEEYIAANQHYIDGI